MSRIVFLDIDGVVAPNWTYKVWRKNGCKKDFESYARLLDPALVKLVDDFATDVGASIVVSSSWRDADSVEGHSVDAVLRFSGLTVPIVGHTPTYVPRPIDRLALQCGAWRGYEINTYIVTHGLLLPDIVILDDDAGAVKSPPDSPVKHGGRVIMTPDATGISPRHIARARKLFGLS